MPKISVDVGCTIRLGDAYSPGGNYFKMNLGLSEIDTEGDISTQLKDGLKATRATFDLLYEMLDGEIEKKLEEKLV